MIRWMCQMNRYINEHPKGDALKGTLRFGCVIGVSKTERDD